MRTHILVSQKVQNEHQKIFAEIKRILDERFDSMVAFEIISEVELRKKPDDLKEAFWENQCRFLCFASDDANMAYNIGKAIKYWVPCVIIKGGEIKEDYILYIQELLKKEKGIKCPDDDCIKKMFYEVDNINDINGGILWINNFYHAMKDSIQADVEQKEKLKLKEFQRSSTLTATAGN